MKRNKLKDNSLFNCNYEYDLNCISGLYLSYQKEVKSYLIKQCKSGTLKYFTHKDVYELINDELGYPVPN